MIRGSVFELLSRQGRKGGITWMESALLNVTGLASSLGMQQTVGRLTLPNKSLNSVPPGAAINFGRLPLQRSLAERTLSVPQQTLGYRSRRGRISCVSSMPISKGGSQQPKSTVAADSSSSQNQTSRVVEHVVFFKVKEDPKSEELFEELRALKSLDAVSELKAGKVLQILGANYTHVLHSRHPNRAALEAYAAHPSHQAVVKKFASIVEDRLAVDWEAQPVGLPIEAGHAAARVAFIKLADDLSEEETSQVFALLNGLPSKFPFIRQTSAGLNFSPARAKGYNLGFVALFDNLEELAQLNGNAELHAELRHSRVSPFLEKFVIADVDAKV